MLRLASNKGYSLIELLLVVIIVGVLAASAAKSMKHNKDITRIEETKVEMDRITYAVLGNPNLASNGTRTDFGYAGDLGTYPSSWSALVKDTPTYSNWDGPYIYDPFASDTVYTEFKKDGWGSDYSKDAYFRIITSINGSDYIYRYLYENTNDITRNKVSAVIIDINFSPPGETYKDSVDFTLTYPSGHGSDTTKVRHPDAGGYVLFDSIPVGIHTLTINISKNYDTTLTRKVCVVPLRRSHVDIRYFSNIW